MKIIDFEYRKEWSFFEYRYRQERLNKNILSPSNDTTLTKVIVEDPGEYSLHEFVPFPSQSCIIMITSPFKNTKWTIDNNDYRARCYTKVVFDSPRNVMFTKYCNNKEEMFIVQGNWHNIETVEPRAFYKSWTTEKRVQQLINKPKPSYIKEYGGFHSIVDNDSETTIVNMTDAGWWFQDQSYTPWYNPYVLSWRKSNMNVLSWRTPVTAGFAFGFEQSPKETAQKHAELIKEHFPKTKKVVYFGQCLGSSKAISTAIEFGADKLYTTSTFFDPIYHRSYNLLKLSGHKSIDALTTIENAKHLPDTKLLYKSMDAEETSEYGRYQYNVGPKDEIKHHVVRYLDVWAPVLSTEPYGIFQFLDNDNKLPDTEVDLNFNESKSLRYRIDTHG